MSERDSHGFYHFLFRAVLRHFEAETAHHLGAFVIKVCGLPLLRSALHSLTVPRHLTPVIVDGKVYQTPFGMAAGFDKNARMIDGLYALGFGHVEIGTVTGRAQPGNPKPRLFRLIVDSALINRMGFNNHGAESAVKRLTRVYSRKHRPIIGANIGKTKNVPLDQAITDYEYSARLLAPVADYLAVNVSSPNTPGLRTLQAVNELKPLLTAVKRVADARAGSVLPVYVKIAPDLTDKELVAICKLVTTLKLDGIIATNTTVSREGLSTPTAMVTMYGEGGLSGLPLSQRSLDVLKLIRKTVPKSMTVISVGGVVTGEDVQHRLSSGANLVQGYTAFLYQGPFWARGINRFLAREVS